MNRQSAQKRRGSEGIPAPSSRHSGQPTDHTSRAPPPKRRKHEGAPMHSSEEPATLAPCDGMASSSSLVLHPRTEEPPTLHGEGRTSVRDSNDSELARVIDNDPAQSTDSPNNVNRPMSTTTTKQRTLSLPESSDERLGGPVVVSPPTSITYPIQLHDTTPPQDPSRISGPPEEPLALDQPRPSHEHLYVQKTHHGLESPGFLNGAHNFVMNHPMMIENTYIGQKSSVLKELSKHTIHGAEFDSSARDPPPQCHPGTRAEIIATVQNQIHQLNPDKQIVWLNGPAGVGKSAIIQTITELEDKGGVLGAALFFSRLDGRNDPSQVWATVSYQLAVKNSSYQAYVQEQLTRDPKLLDKSIRVQFKKLIAEPFGRGQLGKASRSLPIFLDGLDECEGERAQVEIIELISGFVKEFPTALLFWIIASRPEQHLKVTFEDDDLRKGIHMIYVPANSTQGCKDVERYLQKEFGVIRKRYPHSIPPTAPQWPSDSDFLTLARAASGLFVFASAVIRFIDDPKVGNPVSQLEDILSVTKKMASSPKERNPLTLLHQLYTEILGFVPKDVFPITKRILGLIHSLGRRRTKPFREMCNLLGIEQHVAYGALHKLHSVLRIPDPHNAETEEVHIFHASFSDYLFNRDRSGDFWIDKQEIASDRWQCYFGILQQVNISGNPLPRPSSIILKWPSLHSPDDYRLRTKLWTASQREFFYHFLRRPLRYGKSAAFSDPAGMINVLKTVNFSKLATGYFVDSSSLLEFAEQMLHEHRPQFFQSAVLQEFTITDSSYDWIRKDMVSRRVNEAIGHVAEKSYADLSLADNDDDDDDDVQMLLGLRNTAPISELLTDLASHKGRISSGLVAGTKAAGRCVLLAAELNPRSTVYYIIPHSA